MPAQQLVERTKEKISSAAHLPLNPSSQQLVKEPSVPMYHVSSNTNRASRRHRNNITVAILVFVNLINYMDRLTIAGILDQIQSEFDANNAMMGLLQTAFILSYMVFAPLFGYLGDRYSRRNIMAAGVLLWSFFTLIGSFMSGNKLERAPQTSQWANKSYWSFLGCRAMVGIGEASYSTIAPTLISDMFVKEARSKMLALFYFAIPVGSGLGYIVGSKTAEVAGSWQWGLRATPIAGAVAVILILFFLEDPPRGQSEGHGEMQAQTYAEDLSGLAKNKSFVYSTLAFTCVTFCTGALSWWGPVFIAKAIRTVPPDQRTIEPGKVPIIFGAVTMMSGIIGVPLGMFLSTKLKVRYPRADPIICGTGILVSALFLTAGMFCVKNHIIFSFILLFIGEIALNLNWSIVADILLYVVVPTCRSTAEAVQILFSHAFGDAGSPYLIGLVSDGLKTVLDTTGNMCGVNHDNLIQTTVSSNIPIETSTMAMTANVTMLSIAAEDDGVFTEAGADLLNATASALMGGGGPALNDSMVEQFDLDLPCTKVEYLSLLYSLLSNSGIEMIGGILFFMTAIYIVKDKLKCEQISIACRKDGHSEIKMMLPKASPEQSLGDEFPSDDELPQLVKDNSRSTSPV